MNAALLNAPTHVCTATIETTNEVGNTVKLPLTIHFTGMSAKASRELWQGMAATGMPEPDIASYCAAVVTAIPELVDDAGQPVAISQALFDGWALDHVRAVYNAIQDKLHPKR